MNILTIGISEKFLLIDLFQILAIVEMAFFQVLNSQLPHLSIL